jgi:hypothetical protein
MMEKIIKAIILFAYGHTTKEYREYLLNNATDREIIEFVFKFYGSILLDFVGFVAFFICMMLFLAFAG